MNDGRKGYKNERKSDTMIKNFIINHSAGKMFIGKPTYNSGGPMRERKRNHG
jgi:hypothetical protein